MCDVQQACPFWTPWKESTDCLVTCGSGLRVESRELRCGDEECQGGGPVKSSRPVTCKRKPCGKLHLTICVVSSQYSITVRFFPLWQDNGAVGHLGNVPIPAESDLELGQEIAKGMSKGALARTKRFSLVTQKMNAQVRFPVENPHNKKSGCKK